MPVASNNITIELFDKEVLKVLFSSRLLDPHFECIIRESMRSLPPITAAYLEHRVLSEPSNGNAVILHLRRVAERLYLESSREWSVPHFINRLCALVLDYGKRKACDLGIWTENGDITKLDLETDVHAAAIHMQINPKIDKWLASGKTGKEQSPLFGGSFWDAAKYDNHQLLAAIMTQESAKPFRWLRSQIMRIAVGAGNLNTARFVFDFATDEYPWERYDPNNDEKATYYQRHRRLHTLQAPNLEVSHFVRQKQREYCLNWEPSSVEILDHLIGCAGRGEVGMATYLLEIEPRKSYDLFHPLNSSCLRGNEEMVRLLLAHCRFSGCTSCPVWNSLFLKTAIEQGHTGIVRMLLDHGSEHGDAIQTAAKPGYAVILVALLNHRRYDSCSLQPLLVYAIEKEHEAMFRLLINRGADPKDAETSAECIKVARKNGLESMLDLLAEFGVEVGGRTWIKLS